MIEVNWKPTRSDLRLFGLGGAVAMVIVAAWIVLRRRMFGFEIGPQAAHTAGVALAVASGGVVVLAVAWPRALRPVHLALTAVGFVVGGLVSYVLLAAVYFGLFTPIALVFRLLGRDALCRRFDRSAETYWQTREPTSDVRRYFRQF